MKKKRCLEVNCIDFTFSVAVKAGWHVVIISICPACRGSCFQSCRWFETTIYTHQALFDPVKAMPQLTDREPPHFFTPPRRDRDLLGLVRTHRVDLRTVFPHDGLYAPHGRQVPRLNAGSGQHGLHCPGVGGPAGASGPVRHPQTPLGGLQSRRGKGEEGGKERRGG